MVLPPQRSVTAAEQALEQSERRPLTPEEIARLVAALGIIRGEFERKVAALAEGLSTGRITLEQWQTAMRAELRSYHLQSAIIGAGGVVTAAILEVARRAITAQLGYFNRFADELRTGTFPIDATARVRQRAKLYGGAAQATFSEAQGVRLGLPRMPYYPTQGSECMVNCLCHWEYVQVEDGWDCYWRLGIADHCPTCERRAAESNPLRVRNGVIV